MMTDYRLADLSRADRAMLDFAVKLTTASWTVESSDLDALRTVGFGDESIHDIVQVTALFNYYDRLADGLGIEREPEW